MDKLDEKIINIYSNYRGSLKTFPYMKELGIGKKYFNDRVNILFPKEVVNNSEDINKLLEKCNFNTLLFERYLRLGKNYVKHIFNVLVPDIEKLYVNKGMSYKEISNYSKFPSLVTPDKVKGFVTRNKWVHSKEDKENNRIKGIKNYYETSDISIRSAKYRETSLKKYGVDNPMKLPSTVSKAKSTNIRKYGQDSYSKTPEYNLRASATRLKKYGNSKLGGNPLFSDKIRKTLLNRYGVDNIMKLPEFSNKASGKAYSKNGSIKFNPTKYVDSFEYCKEITSSYDNIYKFLSTTFPEKETFTLQEISEITGRPYNTIKRLYRVDGKLITHSKVGLLPLHIKDFLDSLGYKEGEDYLVNDRQVIKPLEIDFYFPKEKVGIEVNDFVTHNSTINRLGGEPKPKNYHMDKSKLCKEKGIRLIHVWEHYFSNDTQYSILQNAIKHALGRSSTRVYARNTYVKEVPNISLKEFFNTNNIQGFRGANRAYALFDKHTDEVLMAYSVGSSHFSHHKYDLELIRGASKLDTTIVGGASKLWKYIIDNNPEVNSIVYYIDRNIYSGSSIGSLEGNLELVSTQVGFWNYFPKTGEIKNRQPSKHKEIKELVSQGKVWEIYNAGTETYVWRRTCAS